MHDRGLTLLAFTTDKQSSEGLRHIVGLAGSCPRFEVVIAGGRAREWEQGLREVLPSVACRCIGDRPRRAESAVALTLHLVERALDGADGADTRYLICGWPASLQGLAERLRARGHKAQWLPALSAELAPELREGMAAELAEAHGRFRRLVDAELAERRIRVVSLSRLSQRVFGEWPELLPPGERRRLFGHRSLRRICEKLGFEVRGSYVQPLDMPRHARRIGHRLGGRHSN